MKIILFASGQNNAKNEDDGFDTQLALERRKSPWVRWREIPFTKMYCRRQKKPAKKSEIRIPGASSLQMQETDSHIPWIHR